MDIVLPGYGFAAQWNLDDDGMLWAIAEESVEQVGCIHNCQGLEFDYVGVIIGDDFVIRDGRVVLRKPADSLQSQSPHCFAGPSEMALKIIGAGFGRTGTMSMKTALEQLGYPCYHMVECFPKGPAHWKLWEQAGTGAAEWDAIFEGFTATVDFPACTSYAALAE